MLGRGGENTDISGVKGLSFRILSFSKRRGSIRLKIEFSEVEMEITLSLVRGVPADPRQSETLYRSKI